MELKTLAHRFSVCRVRTICPQALEALFCFIGKTDEELSLVCLTENAPADALKRDDGWKAFRIQGVLDFSLIGVLAPIADILAAEKIGIFAVSTYNTDYILVKEEAYDRAMAALAKRGYTII